MIVIEKLEDFPPNENPFRHDAEHMGTRIGTNVFVMMPNFESQHCPYLICVNKETGERVKLSFGS